MVDYGEKCKVEHPDKFYVYSLSRPDGTPFYIGKGTRNRINHHFQDWHLKKHNRKNSVIKHYGNQVKRQVIAYFDDEDEAYDVEESLILFYRLLKEGGCLANHTKGRYDSKHILGSDGKNIGAELVKKYSDELVMQALDVFFTEDIYASKVAERFDIPQHYMTNILSGHKRSDLYAQAVTKYGEYPQEKRDRHFREQSRRVRTSCHKLTDQQVLDIFKIWNSKQKTLIELASEYGVSKLYLSSLMTGKSRAYLGISDLRCNKRKVIDDDLKQLIFKMQSEGKFQLEISRATGLHKSSIWRILTNKENISRFSHTKKELYVS